MASRRGESSELPIHRKDKHTMGEAELPTASAISLVSTPIEKKGKWRQTFSLKGKGKERADIYLDSPLSPTVQVLAPSSSHSQTLAVESPSPVDISDTDTIRPDNLRPHGSPKPESTRRPMSTLDSYVMVDAVSERLG